MTDDLTDDIFWIHCTRMPWFDTRLGYLKKEKKKKDTSYICVIYLIYNIYGIYVIFILYISYKLHIYERLSLCYINSTSFTSEIEEPT